MLVQVVARKCLVFMLEDIGFDIDTIDNNTNEQDYQHILGMLKKSYRVFVDMVGVDDDEDLFYHFEDFTPSIDKEQTLFQDLSAIKNKYLRSLIFGVVQEHLKANTQFNGKTFSEWEMIYQ